MNEARWVRVRLEVPARMVEPLEALLLTLGAVAVSLEDARDQPLLEPDPGAMPLWARVQVSGLFVADPDLPDRLEDAAGLWLEQAGFALPEWVLEPLTETDWVAAWRQYVQPLQLGDRLRILPAAEGVDAEAGWAGATLVLAPGLAFGTGAHPTTRGCLQGLAEAPPLGQRVLDFGCGSGILALASLVLGAEQVDGVDHDPQALTASRDNAERNGQGARLQLSLTLPEAGEYDLLLANVLAGPLIELAPLLRPRVRAGGRALLSGILADQVDAVCRAWPDFSFSVHLDAGWAWLDGRKVAR